MLHAIIFLIGFISGLLFFYVRKPFGVLKINPGEEKDIYRFEIDNLDDLEKKKRIIISISKNDISQK